MSTVSDILYAAAIQLGAVQLGEPLTAAESDFLLKTWQRLIDSEGLDRANIHTIRQDTYQLVAGQASYTLGYDPRVTALTVSSATNAAAVVLTLASAHGIAVGKTCSVVIANAQGNWTAINGGFTATSLSTTTVSIPVNSTAFGALTSSQPVTLQVAGTWNYVRPTKIKTANLVYSSGVLSPLVVIDDEQYADITYPAVSGPPLDLYNDDNSPLANITLYPKPDQSYSLVVYSEQALESVSNLTDTVVFAQGYERFHVMSLALESAPAFNVEPSQLLMRNYEEARRNIQSKNRKSPALKTDSVLSQVRRHLYNYRLGL